jgi:restriction system protein
MREGRRWCSSGVRDKVLPRSPARHTKKVHQACAALAMKTAIGHAYEMAIPDYQTLMLPVLSAASVEEVRMSDVIERLADQFHLSQEEREALLPGGHKKTLNDRVYWAKYYLGKAGLVESKKHGFIQTTDKGIKTLASKPQKIDIKFLSQFFKQSENKSSEAKAPEVPVLDESPMSSTQTPYEIMRAAHKDIENALAGELLNLIRARKPVFLEKLILELLKKMRYGDSTFKTGGPGDGGIDGVIHQDILGLDRVYVQAKRYAEGKNVTSGEMQGFVGSLTYHKAVKGVFVTTSGFTPSAVEMAKGGNIVLIDGARLATLMISHEVGCRPEEEPLYFRKVDEDFFGPE